MKVGPGTEERSPSWFYNTVIHCCTHAALVSLLACLWACHIIMTSPGERLPQSMDIKYFRANIKGDMSNFVKNSENFI